MKNRLFSLLVIAGLVIIGDDGRREQSVSPFRKSDCLLLLEPAGTRLLLDGKKYDYNAGGGGGGTLPGSVGKKLPPSANCNRGRS